MKKYTLLALLAVIFTLGLTAQNNASSYYRKFAAEQRKIRTKQVIFYKGGLLEPNELKQDKNRGLVVTQIMASKKALDKMPPFQGDSAMRNDYRRVLNIYLEAYTSAYDTIVVRKKVAGKSAASMQAYRDAINEMEGMVDDAEDMWDKNETYFSNAYSITVQPDPTLVQLNTLRSLSEYVMELRGTYTNVPFALQEMQGNVKSKKFDNLEDMRQNLGLAVDKALVAAERVGAYIDEEDKEDDVLLTSTLRYLDEIKIATDDDMASILSELDAAIYDENNKKKENAVADLENLLTELLLSEEELTHRTQKFVEHYVTE